MEILITASAFGRDHRIGWLSLQPDGSVSVGLADRTFISPEFEAQQFVWSAFNRTTLQYLVKSDPTLLRAVRSPHLSFHPPGWFHFKGNGQKTLFEGIADLQMMLKQDGNVPWVRFVSKRVCELPSAGLPRKLDRVKIINIKPASDQCSIGLALDFIALGTTSKDSSGVVSEVIPWRTYSLHLHAVELPAQIATLSWYHQN